jgi:hypothetical protein
MKNNAWYARLRKTYTSTIYFLVQGGGRQASNTVAGAIYVQGITI